MGQSRRRCGPVPAQMWASVCSRGETAGGGRRRCSKHQLHGCEHPVARADLRTQQQKCNAARRNDAMKPRNMKIVNRRYARHTVQQEGEARGGEARRWGGEEGEEGEEGGGPREPRRSRTANGSMAAQAAPARTRSTADSAQPLRHDAALESTCGQRGLRQHESIVRQRLHGSRASSAASSRCVSVRFPSTSS